MAPTRSTFERDVALERLTAEHFDVLVIGGGITGAGVALDAASRGLSVALVEARDLAWGTSSRSSKLVHGGLRYLRHGEIGLVHESLLERQRLLANAPHLVSRLEIVVPLLSRHRAMGAALAGSYSGALWAYDLAGGLLIGRRHHRIGRAEILQRLPTLRGDDLVAGWTYPDARADDARLTLAVARTAVLHHGAVVATYAPVSSILGGPGARAAPAQGAVLSPAEGELEVRASAVVNATGVWAARLDAGQNIRPAKGIHVALRRERAPWDFAAVLPVPSDRRTIFVVPWGDHVYVGTTDTDYDGPLEEPYATASDVAYLLDAFNACASSAVSPADVTGVWSGLRPLLAGEGGGDLRTADLSRRHHVTVGRDGVVSVTGGKLTTYRKMAADTMDLVVERIGKGSRKSRTRSLRLRGAGPRGGRRAHGAPQQPEGPAEKHLRERYGTEAAAVLAIAGESPELSEPLVPGLPYLGAEAVFAARYEMAHTLEDVLSRRARALLLDRLATAKAAPAVAELVGHELGWDAARRQQQVRDLVDLVAAEGRAAGLEVPATASSGGKSGA